MAQVTRSTKISGGTTLQSNTLARAADVETDMLTLYAAHNAHDIAASTWTAVSATGTSTVPMTADNSSGTQNIFNAKDNGVISFSIADGGIVTFAPGGTTKVVVNSSGMTLSNSATLAMGAAKITGLAAATASGDALRYEQLLLLTAYRRPVLQWSSITQVNLETGNLGTASSASILFPDGTVRSDTSSTHLNFVITRNAALSGSAQSGLRTSLSEATNTWYALYAVKVTDSSTDFVVVGDTLQPTQANFASLNSNFGTNGWVYLGIIGNGDNSGATGDIMKFYMAGNRTILVNATTGNVATGNGVRLATTASATSVTFTYAAGTTISTPQIPNSVTIGLYTCAHQNGANTENILNGGGTYNLFSYKAAAGIAGFFTVEHPVAEGIQMVSGGAEGHDIFLRGFVDGALGVGSNPLL